VIPADFLPSTGHSLTKLCATVNDAPSYEDLMHKPVWELFLDGTATPIPWIDHPANTRFAIFSAGTPNQVDDLVWDKETGLVWPRNASVGGATQNWFDASTTARELKFANRIGWRLPTVEELSSLVDTRRANPALPTGHPFLTIQTAAAYWTSTNAEAPIPSPGAAWFVNLAVGAAGQLGKGNQAFKWPVRAGRGGVSWTP
jgi:hypothetical protein